MKLSELEALAASATLYGDGDIYCIYTSDPNDLLEFCAAFREMLEAMRRQAIVLETLGVWPTPFLLATIKKAEEML